MNASRRISSLVMIATLSLGLAGAASAQGFGISFQKGRHGKSFGLRLDAGSCGHHRHTSCCRQWIAPRCETVRERVWVEGRCRRVWSPPRYRVVRDRCGRTRRVCVSRGFHRTVKGRGHYRFVDRQVRRPGRWVTTCGY